MPTLLGLAGIPVPETCEGRDHAPAVLGEAFTGNEAAYIMSIAPFSEYRGQPWRGIRTRRHTYVRNLEGSWLLFDNQEDPYQMRNLAGSVEHADLQRRLDDQLKMRCPAGATRCFPRDTTLIFTATKWANRGRSPFGHLSKPSGRR